MSSGVGGVGAAGGCGSAGGASGAAPAAPAGNVGGESAAATEGVGGDTGSEKDASCSVPPMCDHGSNMSTQSFVEIHNTAITQVNESQSSDMDLKKLIEMMMAIKLLEAMNENK